MRITWRLATLLVVIPTFTLAAWQQHSHLHSRMAAQELGWAELTESMHKMHASMGSVQPSGGSDLDFVNLMVPHHQAAIDMAKAELMYGRDPQVRRLAQEIITDQQSEIELMQLSLKQCRARSSKPGHASDTRQ